MQKHYKYKQRKRRDVLFQAESCQLISNQNLSNPNQQSYPIHFIHQNVSQQIFIRPKNDNLLNINSKSSQRNEQSTFQKGQDRFRSLNKREEDKINQNIRNISEQKNKELSIQKIKNKQIENSKLKRKNTIKRQKRQILTQPLQENIQQNKIIKEYPFIPDEKHVSKINQDNSIKSYDNSDIYKDFVMQSFKVDSKMKFILSKKQHNLSNYFQIKSGQDIVLFAENKIGSIGCNYYINVVKSHQKNSYIGKVRGNFHETFYKIYNKGQNPQNHANKLKWRVTLADIKYFIQKIQNKIQRAIKVDIPNLTHNYNFDNFKLEQNNNLQRLSTQLLGCIHSYKNIHKHQKEFHQLYKLKDQNKVRQIFQTITLRNIQNSQQSPFILNKIDELNYSIEVSYPFSLFQAFAIAITMFDSGFL